VPVWEVEVTDQFADWWRSLASDQQEAVTDRVDLLAERGRTVLDGVGDAFDPVVSDRVEGVPAVVQAWYRGAQAGPGLADVLLGAVHPSALLPFSTTRAPLARHA
jgi:hypothetical protein